MKRILLLVLLITASASAQEQRVHGTITYVAAGTVYTSLGKAHGVQDSSLVYVIAHSDTVALMKVFAVSSTSSACYVVRSKQEPAVGNAVNAVVLIAEQKEIEPQHVEKTGTTATMTTKTPIIRASRARKEETSFQVDGRVGIQYWAAHSAQSEFDMAQPGLVLSLRGSTPNHPFKFELYSNARTMARGSSNPFSARASNETRVYHLSLEYDDGATMMAVGRITPRYAPSIGYLDGASLARRFGPVTVGSAIGLQPDSKYQGLATAYKKLIVFAQYQSTRATRASSVSVTTAYARTYRRSHLDREAASVIVNAFFSSELSLYASTDVDLRTRSGDRLIVAPSLSMLLLAMHYRARDFLTVSIGGDAARPLYPFSSIQFVPDSLLDSRLRAGVTLGLNFLLPNGMSIYNALTPRTAEKGFGQEYSNYTSVQIPNVVSSGATVRGAFTLNRTEVLNARIYGVSLQRRLLAADVNVRYQRVRSYMSRSGETGTSETVGVDWVHLFSRTLTLLASYDRARGHGPTFSTIFAELSWRL